MKREFSFATVRTERDWRTWGQRNARTTDDGVTIATDTKLRRSELGVEATDLDVAPNCNVALLTADGQIRVYVRTEDECKRLTLRGLEDCGVDEPTAIGVDASHIYLASEQERRVAAFERRPRRLSWTTTLEDAPQSITGSRTGAYVLHDDGSVRFLSPSGRDRQVATGLTAPVDLAVGPADDLYLLDDRDDGVGLYEAPARYERGAPRDLERRSVPDDVTLERVAAREDSQVVLLGTAPDGGASLVEYDLTADEWTRFEVPGSAATGLVSPDAAADRVAYVVGDGVAALDRSLINRKDPENTRYEARLVGRFDAGVPDMEWHRATLSADRVGPETRIDVRYFAANDPELQRGSLEAALDVSEERRALLESSGVETIWDVVEHTAAELAGVVPDASRETAGSWLRTARQATERTFDQREDVREVHDPADFLLKEATGQHLCVEVRLVGRQRSAPRLNAITAYCPRRTLVRYLPEIYRQQEADRPMLGRFLSIFESLLFDIEDELDRHTELLDPQEVPLDALPWLNEWLGLQMGDTWPESARRELLDRATELYRMRGTNRGLRALLEIYLDHATRLRDAGQSTLPGIERRLEALADADHLTSREGAETIEAYRRRFERDATPPVFFFEHDQLSSLSEEDREAYYETLVGHPRRFRLFLSQEVPEHHVGPIEELVTAEKPAYTDVVVDRLESEFRLGAPTFLGVNSVCPPPDFALGRSRLGRRRPKLEPNS